MTITDTKTELQVEILRLRKTALVFRAINHNLRQQMLQLIHQNGRISVTEIYKKLRLEQSVASQHLAILREAGFVNTERDRKFIFYSVNYARLKQVHEITNSLLKKEK
jgi:DNA-binding transcriptional ArsR family regulator